MARSSYALRQNEPISPLILLQTARSIRPLLAPVDLTMRRLPSAGQDHRCNARAVDGALGTELLIAFKRRSMKVIWSSVSALIKSGIPIYKIISGTDFRTG